MIRRRFLLLGAILAGIAMTGLAPAARADFEVAFSVNGASATIDGTTHTSSGTGGATIIYGSGQITIIGLSVGGFLVDATIATSNSPGSVNVATISLSGLSIKNISQNDGGGKGALTITTSATGFNNPSVGNATLTSTISATAGGANSADASVAFSSAIIVNSVPTATPAIDLTAIAKGTSQSGNSSVGLDVTQTPYSLTQTATITLHTTDSLTDMSSGTSLYAPAPAGSMLALSGLPILGLAYLRRRVRHAVS